MPGFADVLTDVYRGAQAHAWAADRGWTFAADAGEVEVLTREFRTDRFTVSLTRTSTPARSTPAERSAMYFLAMLVSGQAKARADDGVPRILRQGTILLTEKGTSLEIEPMGAVTVLVVQSSWSRLHTVDHSTRFLPGADQAARELRRVLLALVTPVIATSDAAASGQVMHLQSAIESIVSAVIDQADLARPKGTTSAERDLLTRAVTLIQTAATDPTFSMDELSRTLGVSKPYVQRVFRHAGTTPMRYLASVRTQLAMRMLDGHSVTRRVELESIARAAGFVSVRSMRASMKRYTESDRTRSFVAALRDDRIVSPLGRAA
ncbi:helix-turn-helix domain-containing protein [Microbacteriaceae bacterium VKM Ac-2854]|nr:helix-turn-helix domain-containing protein [Microbacteriaceae bacterium VKM Ac-2854]